MDDLISRQAAIDHLKKRLYETALNNNTEHPYYEEMADNRVDVWLNELPSAEKHGKWIRKSEGMWTCSECKRDNVYAYLYENDFKNFKQQDFYCPNCGARMDGEE